MIAKGDRMYAYLCSCAICGAFLPPIYYVCETCWKDLYKESGSYLCRDLRWPIHYVWNWKTRGSSIHELLLRRKGAHILNAEQRLAQQGVLCLPADEREKIDIVYYPSKREGHKDHTFYLAREVGLILGVEICGVVIPEVFNYKSFGRRKRQEVRRVVPQSQIEYKAAHPLFVDDVVTTGATMEAVWKVLGRPEHLQGLCLAYKTFNPEDKV